MSSTDIFKAAEEGNLDDVKSFIDEKGINVNVRDTYGKTPLHAAVGAESIEIVEFLVSKNADVNAEDVEKKTPLHWATIYNDNIEVAKLLVSKGANVNAQNKYGYTPLHNVIERKNIELFRFLVLEGKADVNAKDSDGSTPLHSAVMKNNVDFAKILISAGANTNVKNNRGSTPLDLANGSGNMAMVQSLSNHSSKKTDAYCQKCRTPIYKDWHIIFKTCYKCANTALVEEIDEYKKRWKIEKNKRIFVIAFSIIGAIVGASIAAPLATDNKWGFLGLVWLCLGIGGNFRVSVSELPEAWKVARDTAESFWGALAGTLFITMFFLLLKSLIGPLIPLLKIEDYTMNMKTAMSEITKGTKLLGKMSDYYQYTQYVEEHGNNMNLAKLTEQGGELFNNKYAKAVLQIGKEDAQSRFMSDDYETDDPAVVIEKQKSNTAKFKFLIPIGIGLLFSLWLLINHINTKNNIEGKKSNIQTIITGTFTDDRDGKNYKTVSIGSQTWLAENLNYKAKNSKCYNDVSENCNIYGRYYNWNTAMKACPKGWHLPSNAEWDNLYRYVDGTNGTDSPYESPDAGKHLKANSGWNDFNGKPGNGLDSYGFTALPGGSHTGKFNLAGDNGYWWSASEGEDSNAYYRFMLKESSGAGWNNKTKSLLLNVRCVH